MILIKAPDSCWGPCLSFYYSILNWYLLGKAIIFRKATNGCWRPRLSLWYFQMILFIIKAANRLWLHDFIVFSNDTFFYLKSHDLKKKKNPQTVIWDLTYLYGTVVFSNGAVVRKSIDSCWRTCTPLYYSQMILFSEEPWTTAWNSSGQQSVWGRRWLSCGRPNTQHCGSAPLRPGQCCRHCARWALSNWLHQTLVVT